MDEEDYLDDSEDGALSDMEEYDPDAPNEPAAAAAVAAAELEEGVDDEIDALESKTGSLTLEQEAAELAATAEAHAVAAIKAPKATGAEPAAPALSTEAAIEAQMAAAKAKIEAAAAAREEASKPAAAANAPPVPAAPEAAEVAPPAKAATSRGSSGSARAPAAGASAPSAEAAPKRKPTPPAPASAPAPVPLPKATPKAPPPPKLPRANSEARSAAGVRSESGTGRPPALKTSTSASPLKPAAKPKPPAKPAAPPPVAPGSLVESSSAAKTAKTVFMPRQRAVAGSGPAGALVEAPVPVKRSPTRVAQARVTERAMQALTEAQHEQWQRVLMSEWLTQHPLVLRYPPHIWLHADCPQPDGEGGEIGEIGPGESREEEPQQPASPQRQQVQYSNKLAIVYLQSGELDKALLVLKEMEENIRSNLTGRERLQVLPVVMNNLAYFYYRKHKYPAAHSYMTKAMQLERKAYGAVDFATHLRMAAVSARLSHHTVSLKHCKAALKVLQEAAGLHGGHGGPPAAARTYHAHLAVVYHNLAVQMAYLQQLQHASGTAKVAQQLVTQALPAKHRWVRHISSSARRLRDMHLSTSFVEHSLRPGIAGRTPHAAQASDDEVDVEKEMHSEEEEEEESRSLGMAARPLS